MATPFHLPVTAAHVGTHFVGHYYQVLQTQPDFVHRFYSDRSTLLRVDGLPHIGSVHVKDFSNRRNFVQTFFLAPLEKGYFVLNDIFHFIDNQPFFHYPVTYMTQNNLVSKLNALTALGEQASSYMSSGDIQGRDFVPPTTVEENGTVNNYSFQEQQLQPPEAESIREGKYAVKTNGSDQNKVNALQDHLTPVEEVLGEPQKHTYASILQVAKGHSAPSAHREQPATKGAAYSELNHVQESPAAASTVERSGSEAVEDTTVDDEGEVKSVYVRNVPSHATASEIEEEFKKFGKIRQNGVAIRTRKDIDVCYAFVEYEDITGVNNAIKATTAEITGQQVYIEGRQANRSNNVFRGGRGRGRGGYQMEGRGRFGGRNYSSRENGHDANDYTRPKGNGYYRHQPHQDRTYSNSNIFLETVTSHPNELPNHGHEAH